ncbi:MAG: leucine-rich repeat domain-containing protein [Lachnospiraceae bacterium]|nr:leucine-rich repeat domain-containing protein [Lachnospiraceae bacterium]
MKKLKTFPLAVVLVLGFMLFFFCLQDQEVQAKTKVTYTLKKGTLTIKGKGSMPSKMTFKNNKKIKKVVIKSGVTSIPKNAFYGCKNLTSATVAKSVTSVGQEAFVQCNKLKTLTIPGNFNLKVDKKNPDEIFYCIADGKELQTVKFNTKLKLENATYFYTNAFKLTSSDPKYKSIDGVIYTKNGKGIVRVPYKRTSLILDKNCTEFNLWSILYEIVEAEGDMVYGCQIKSITIPVSVTKINDSKYASKHYKNAELALKKLKIETTKLDSWSINTLINVIESFDENGFLKIEDIAGQLPDKQIHLSNDMYLSDDGFLYKYVGKNSSVTIPESIKMVGSEAFYFQDTVKSVVFPDTVTTIGDRAFMYTGLTSLTLPNSVQSIGESAFYGVFIKKIVIPDKVTVIKEDTFANCDQMTSIILGKSVREIQKSAFAGTSWKNLTILSTVTKISEDAFANNDFAKKVVIEGKTSGIDPKAFSFCQSLKFYYKSTPNQYQTCVEMLSRDESKKGRAKVEFEWNKVDGVSGYQVKLSTNKKFTKNVKTINLKSNKTSGEATVKNQNQTEYIRIRPYTMVNGKKVYGRWAMNEI